jgi:hypothetical protein
MIVLADLDALNAAGLTMTQDDASQVWHQET